MSNIDEKKFTEALEFRTKKVKDAMEEEHNLAYSTATMVNFKPTLILSYRFLQLKKLGQLNEKLKERLKKRKSAAFFQRIRDAEDREIAYEKQNQLKYDEARRKAELEDRKIEMLHLLEYQEMRRRSLVKLKASKSKSLNRS